MTAATGRPLLVGSRPLQLWPLLLCKAILKVMAVYRSLDMTLPHQVGVCVRVKLAAAVLLATAHAFATQHSTRGCQDLAKK